MLTIVIPAYNRALTLPRTLASVEAQTLRPLRVVLVDNNSTDATHAIMDEWAAHDNGIDTVIVSQPRRGACAARNAGLERVTTPYTMFFDSDDEMLPTHCAEMLAAFESTGCDIAGRPVEMHLLGGKVATGKFTADKPLFNHLIHAVLSTQRYAARTELFRAVGGWKERVAGWNDFELGLRLLLAHPRIVQISDEPAVVMHSQVDSITGVDFSSSPSKWEYSLDTCDADIEAAAAVDDRTRRILHTLIDIRRCILAAHYWREGSRSDARRLMRKALQGKRLYARAVLRLLHRQNRLYPHGTGRLASLFFHDIRL